MGSAQVDRRLAVVAGDVTIDWNLARVEGDGDSSVAWNPDDVARACRQHGGALMLADLVKAVASTGTEGLAGEWEVRSVELPVEEVQPGDGRFHHSWAMWSPYDYDSRGGRRVWRVKEFLGLDVSHDGPEALPAEWRAPGNDTPRPDLVVLDDAGLGFRDEPELWPAAVREGQGGGWTVVKMARPVAYGPLWERLVSRCCERLIVVTSVGDMRRTEVHISQELSWERTAQDLFWELTHNPRVNGLARCAYAVVSFYTAGALLLSRRDPGPADEAAPPAWDCRLVFDPTIVEGQWQEAYPGGMIGYTTCLTAGIVRELMAPEPNVERGIQAGLSAMRRLHREGYGTQPPNGPLLEPAFPTDLMADEIAHPQEQFAAATVQNPVRFLHQPQESEGRGRGFWTILDDVCSGQALAGPECDERLAATAAQIALYGPEKALSGVPTGSFGKLITADRCEIEGYRSVRRLITQYCRQRQDKPLAIAVFGPPGAGKSFGVKQVAASVAGANIEDITFNLSQFSSPDDLVDALHRVRDVGLSGSTPLVFWDEFDSPLGEAEHGWLRYFLAPIQDGAFQDGQITHHIGRAIFVFAGGTCATMEGFDRGADDQDFVKAKGPDLVSRLKGFVNIMGPNCQADTPGGDPHYLIRRAILLRSLLMRDTPRLLGAADGARILRIDPGVLRAFLRVTKYKHGVRSMEAIVSMSSLADRDRYERSCLPSAEQLNLHVDGIQFLSLVQQPVFEGPLLEALAATTHEVYCESVASHKPLPPAAKLCYGDLDEELKEQNRQFVRHMLTKLHSIGYVLIPARSDDPPFGFPGEHLEFLADMEHDRWMLQKLADGWRWGSERSDEGRANPNLLAWRELEPGELERRYGSCADRIGPGALPDDVKQWDRDLVMAIPDILARAGYTVVQLDRPGEEA